MKKLTVEVQSRGENAPAKSIMAILSTWSELAELVDQKVLLAKGCQLVWHLQFQHVAYRGHVLSGFFETVKPEDKGDCWEAYSTVSMTHHACTLYETGHRDNMIDLPLTSVSEIMINDNGTFSWHGEMKRPAENAESIEKLAQALSEGELPSGHHYACNHFPPLAVKQPA